MAPLFNMKKVIISTTPRGFQLPLEFAAGLFVLNKTKYFEFYKTSDFDIKGYSPSIKELMTYIEADDGIYFLCMSTEGIREDLDLVNLVESNAASLPYLKVVSIPEDVEYHIGENEYGIEYVVEDHRIWH